jgi:hypothetical protein
VSPGTPSSPRRAPRGLALAIALALLAGCPGADTSPAAWCELACKRDEMCRPISGSQFCRADCGDRALGLEPAFFEAYMECYSQVRCDDPVMVCESVAGNQVERRPIDDNFLSTCQAKHRECNEGFNLAFCFQSHYYLIEWIERAYSCLLMTCGAVELCLAREMPFAPFFR